MRACGHRTSDGDQWPALSTCLHCTGRPVRARSGAPSPSRPIPPAAAGVISEQMPSASPTPSNASREIQHLPIAPRNAHVADQMCAEILMVFRTVRRQVCRAYFVRSDETPNPLIGVAGRIHLLPVSGTRHAVTGIGRKPCCPGSRTVSVLLRPLLRQKAFR